MKTTDKIFLSLNVFWLNKRKCDLKDERERNKIMILIIRYYAFCIGLSCALMINHSHGEISPHNTKLQ